MRFSSIYALAASLSTAAATSQGFNYGSTKSDGTFNYQADFESLFSAAKALTGTNSGFTSARLYTTIQGGSSTNEPTQAIPAAIAQGTTLLLGLWASGGQGPLSAELIAINSALTQYGDAFAKLVVGISVGSEDLYRNSPTGEAANAGIGADAATIASYIGQVRSALKGTALANAPIGHVDTWTAWAESTDSNLNEVISACDFIGMDAYPYFQNTMANSLSDGKSLFNAALAATQGAVGGKPVWITETGWPVSGKTENLAVPSLANAKTYWDEVGCPNFGTVNTWWYTLQDTNGATPNPSFGIIGSSYNSAPLYDLSCSDVSSSSSSSSSSGSTSSSSSSGPSSTEASSSASAASVSSASSSAASAGSSLVSAASSGPVASSGSGLSPSEGAGNGIGSSATTTAPSSSATGSASGNSTVSVGTGSGSSTLGTVTNTGSGPSTSPSVAANAANALSGSFVGALGAIFAAIAAL